MNDSAATAPDERGSVRFADLAMEVWHEWKHDPREFGWPDHSSLSAATDSIQAQTRTDGIAKWRGKGDPPPMPKETKPSLTSRIPHFDFAKLGPEVDRHLRDLCSETNGEKAAQVLVLRVQNPGIAISALAIEAGLKERTFKMHLDRGRLWLTARLTAPKRDW